MKVVHVPFSYYPDPVGGTEVYVEALAREQLRCGLDVIVAAPADEEAAYDHRGIQVRRYQVAKRPADLRELYGEGDPIAARGFAGILDDEAPDLVHLHAFTRGVSLRIVKEARQRRLPVVFTYHTPTVSCQRGTMMRWGTDRCNGELDVRACAQCTLHGLGLNRALSTAVGWIPAKTALLIASCGSTRVQTALSMPELVRLRHASFQRLMMEVDHVVAVCEWVKNVLLRNGVPEEKVTISRQGLCQSEVGSTHNATAKRRSPLRLVFFGRLDPTKGLHIVLAAMRAAAGLPVTLDIYGITQGHGDAASYHRSLIQQAQGDARITFIRPVCAELVPCTMRNYDAVVVPSQWLETGPLVVLEAFAAGVPVLGSNIGGISELVTDGVDGLLLHTESQSWHQAIAKLCNDDTLLSRLRTGIRPPRLITDVAEDMTGIYECVRLNGREGRAMCQ